ncbi:MAG: UDP-N-acetylmuramate dehydrogenase [Planctomycetes bacterium]|nr:UDP-N-acetylmuramate dehydrogenase [Planctomycetota bacterium]
MSIFNGLEEIVRTDRILAKESWYGLGGPADYFIRPVSVEQLGDVVRRCNDNGIVTKVLGFGSNLLISDDGVRGAVIKLDSDAFKEVTFAGEEITAGAGAQMSKLVLDCVDKGLSGLEALTGIPGSVGGAVRMNAGGKFGDISSAVESVTLMDSKGEVFEKSKPELSFDYRNCNITASFILSAKMKLNEADSDQILRTVKEMWIYKKNNQPLNTKNSGCIFKNPRDTSAGALIDRAGLKGLQIGGAVVSDKHANFIVAQKGCSSRDVLRLIEAIQQRVKESFGVDLELELEVWD